MSWILSGVCRSHRVARFFNALNFLVLHLQISEIGKASEVSTNIDSNNNWPTSTLLYVIFCNSYLPNLIVNNFKSKIDQQKVSVPNPSIVITPCRGGR